MLDYEHWARSRSPFPGRWLSHKPGGRLPLLSTRPAVTFPAKDITLLAATKLYCLVTEFKVLALKQQKKLCSRECEHVLRAFYGSHASNQLNRNKYISQSSVRDKIQPPNSGRAIILQFKVPLSSFWRQLSQSLHWQKNLVFPTNHLTDTRKLNIYCNQSITQKD